MRPTRRLPAGQTGRTERKGGRKVEGEEASARPPQLAPRWVASEPSRGLYRRTQWALFIPKESEGRAGPSWPPHEPALVPTLVLSSGGQILRALRVWGSHGVCRGCPSAQQLGTVNRVTWRGPFFSSSTDLASRREEKHCRVTQGGPRFPSGSHISDHAEIPVWGYRPRGGPGLYKDRSCPYSKAAGGPGLGSSPRGGSWHPGLGALFPRTGSWPACFFNHQSPMLPL